LAPKITKLCFGFEVVWHQILYKIDKIDGMWEIIIFESLLTTIKFRKNIFDAPALCNKLKHVKIPDMYNRFKYEN